MQSVHEDRVRALAYQIWESEGKPTGHEYRHWEMASMLANDQESEELEVVAAEAGNNVPAETYNIDPSNRTGADVSNIEAEPNQAKKSRKKSATKFDS